MKGLNLPTGMLASALGSIVLLYAGATSAAPVSGGYGTAGESGAAPILCERGFVFSKSNQLCLNVGSGRFAEGELYEQGEALARAGYYEKALDALGAIENQHDSRVLTMTGYSKRKLGRFDEGIKDYLKALSLDPHNADAREYLGEGYLETGRGDLALIELGKIEVICGNRECEQYRDLETAITRAPK